MTVNRSILILILLLVQIRCFSQRKFEPVIFYYHPSFGGVFPASSHKTGYITDHLLEYGSEKAYAQFFGMGIFFKNVGLEGSFSLSPVTGRRAAQRHFSDEVNAIYSDRYYTTIASGNLYSYDDGSEDAVVRASVGPTYKIERNWWILVCRAMVGGMSVNTNSGSARLKAKGTNELMHVKWSTNDASKDFFSINPSVTFGCRLGKRLILDIDISSWIYKTDFTYSEDRTNEVSGALVTKSYRYNHLARDISLGVGLMLVFK